MNTKNLMIASSIIMGLVGLAASFMPKEILNAIVETPTNLTVLGVQITGALYIGFAIMNWMAKTILIGGIYARPLCMGNFVHFMVAGLALLKASFNEAIPNSIWILTAVYVLFAVLFGIVLFTHPTAGGPARN